MRRSLPRQADHDHRGNQGDEPGNQAPQPRRDLQVQKALHDDLAGQRPRQGRTLPGAQKRDGKQDRGAPAQERGQQLVRRLDGRYLDTMAVKNRCAQDQDCRIDEERGVQRDRGIE